MNARDIRKALTCADQKKIPMANIAEANALNKVSINQLSMVRTESVFTLRFNKSGTLLVYNITPVANTEVAKALRIVTSIQLSMFFKRSTSTPGYKEVGGTVEPSVAGEGVRGARDA